MQKILFLCSPGLGLLDTWAPILEKLSNKYEIDFFVIKPGILENISKEKFFYEILKKNFKNFYSISKKEKIYQIKNLKKNNLSFLEKVSENLNRNNVRFFNKEFNIYNYIFKHNIFKKKQKVEYKNFLNNYKFILCDAIELTKDSLKEFATSAKHIDKISINHGSGFPYTKKFSFNKQNDLGDKFKIVLFSKTKQEINFFQTMLKLNENNYIRLGNPKHEKSWIKKISNKYEKKYFNGKKYIFLISRHTDGKYFTDKKKIILIKQIKKIVIDKMGYNLVIKTHPKENINEYYFKILGKKFYKKNWIISKNHPYGISKNAFFSISFFSDLANDMNAAGIPNIELLNLQNLKNLDKKDVFIKNKIKMFRIRYLNLTLGSSNEKGFELLINDIILRRKNIIKDLNKTYMKYFINPNNSKKITQLFKKN
ncbi:hypothetical protein ABXT47_00730 [Candidatus Pelagibacter sp. Uisw_099_02]|uniref:hypothetical protein n=1 Tax=Candidatus Pelagibacter sp. Uisw_099_02 TaxID=3230981 RepID=UPI0039E91B50